MEQTRTLKLDDNLKHELNRLWDEACQLLAITISSKKTARDYSDCRAKCFQGLAKPAQNSAEGNLQSGESRRKIVVNEPDEKKFSVTCTGSKARLSHQPEESPYKAR